MALFNYCCRAFCILVHWWNKLMFYRVSIQWFVSVWCGTHQNQETTYLHQGILVMISLYPFAYPSWTCLSTITSGTVVGHTHQFSAERLAEISKITGRVCDLVKTHGGLVLTHGKICSITSNKCVKAKEFIYLRLNVLRQIM